jgi:hypothetical protein
MSESVILIKADPVMVPLTDESLVSYFFGISSKTVMQWHHKYGFPVTFAGTGRGRRGYVPVREARTFMKRRSELLNI